MSYIAAGPVVVLSYIICVCHLDFMEIDPEHDERAVAIEYWVVSALVSGAFLVGLGRAIHYLIA